MHAFAVAIGILITVLWLAWIVFWVAAARGAKSTRWREPMERRLLHGIPLVLAMLLLIAPKRLPGLLMRFAPQGGLLLALGAAAVAADLGLAVWARVSLGRNWSSQVEVKRDHALVCDGPYRLVRHPIYTGMLLAIAGTALAIGEWRGMLATGFALIGILVRVGAEEREMRRLFPEYERYRKETAALIPFLV
jgi:protein-S-isoprenylcysteine O-methyltransferase Ste14